MIAYIIIAIAFFIFGGCFGFCIAALLSASKTVEAIDKIFEEEQHYDESK